jgi:hypothetical protein
MEELIANLFLYYQCELIVVACFENICGHFFFWHNYSGQEI